MGGDDGRGMIAEADAAMEGEGIADPQRLSAMLVPGRWRGVA